MMSTFGARERALKRFQSGIPQRPWVLGWASALARGSGREPRCSGVGGRVTPRRADDLEGDRPAGAFIVGLVDAPHPALAEQLLDAITAGGTHGLSEERTRRKQFCGALRRRLVHVRPAV